MLAQKQQGRSRLVPFSGPVFAATTEKAPWKEGSMNRYHYTYPVRLSEEQRRFLETMVHLSSTPAKHYLVARVLLMSEQSQGEPSHTDGQIAEMLAISRRTVIRIKQRFVQENLGVALAGSFPRECPER